MNKYTRFFLAAAVAVVSDQLTKWYIRVTVPLHTSVSIVDEVFHLTHVNNPGGAFSLFADGHPSLRRPFFLLVAVIAIGVLLYMMRKVAEEQRLLTLALGILLGGALGNFIDRLRFGAVTDFLDLQWRGYHWPAFNVADSCISIGIAVLFAFSLFGEEPDARAT